MKNYLWSALARRRFKAKRTAFKSGVNPPHAKWLTLLIVFLIGATSFADDLSQLYERACFLETAKGQTKEAMDLFHQIIREVPTVENRKQLAQAADKLTELHEEQQDSSFASKIITFDMKPRFYDHLVLTFGEPEALFSKEETNESKDLPDEFTLRYPNQFWITVNDNNVEEYRFGQPLIDIFSITPGSSLSTVTNLFKPEKTIEVDQLPDSPERKILYQIGDTNHYVYTISKDDYFKIENGQVNLLVLRDMFWLKASYKRHNKGCKHMRKVPLPPPSKEHAKSALSAYDICFESTTNHTAAIKALKQFSLALGDPCGDTIFDKAMALGMDPFPCAHVAATFGEPIAYLAYGNATPKEDLESRYTMAYLDGFNVKIDDGKIKELLWNKPGITFNGIGIGNSSDDVLAAFPPSRSPTRFWKNAVRTLVINKDGEAKTYRASRGLSFRFIQNKVYRISVTDNRELNGIAIQQIEQTP